MRLNRFVAVVWLVLSLGPVSTTLAATPDEMNFLSLYFSEEELEVFSATRSLKSVASVAENIVIVTAEDIELMNVHSVAEALYNVTGIEMVEFKGHGAGGSASIHGSGKNRVAVLLDGVPLTSANNDIQLAVLPVQMVRRIEVIKGPASAAWGSSFGGVINVITKSVASGDRFDGTLLAAGGQNQTSDLRGEISARKDWFGVYLYGGGMESDGLFADRGFAHKNFFGKLNLGAGQKTGIDLSFFSHSSDSVNADFLLLGQDASEGFRLESLYGKADLRTLVADAVDLRLSAWRLRNDDNFYAKQLSTGRVTRDAPILFDRYGFNGSLARRTQHHAFVAGADWSSVRYEEGFGSRASIDQDTFALFVNDTVTAGKLSITPGLRYDHSSLAGSVVSPSLGATYLASRDLLFRAVVSRGFHAPAIVKYLDAPAFGYVANTELASEKIWSYQAGVEANVADLLRAKLSLFHHDIDDLLVDKVLGSGTFTTENGGRSQATGGEFEIATNRYKGFVFTSGVHYEQIRLIDFIDPQYPGLRDVYGVNATLDYHGKSGLKGTMKAHYGWLDVPEAWNPESRGVVVDLSISQRILDAGNVALELFAGAHNIFDADSYSDQIHKNLGRWFEGGVRCTF